MTKDIWTEGYKAYGRGIVRSPYMDDAAKAREFFAGWMAAKADAINSGKR